MNPLTWVFFITGLVFGSFFNVCILRIPEGTFFKTHRSNCPKCQSPIPFYLNVPVISWLMLRGIARCCGEKISVQYPLVEFATGLIFIFVYWNFPFLVKIDGGYHFESLQFIRFLHALILFSVLFISSVIDIRLLIIPDVFSLGLVATAPIWVFIHPELTWKSSLIGILVGGGVLYAVAWIYWLLRKQAGMGMGDVKLLAGMGGWLGYESIFPTVFYASITGSILGIAMVFIGKRSDLKFEIPFGPFLALGGLLFMFSGTYFIDLVISR